jgi:hypothetical protein
MVKPFWSVLACSLTLGSSGLWLDGPVMSGEQTIPSPSGAVTTSFYLGELEEGEGDSWQGRSSDDPSGMEQVTAVAQLTDVRPADWAFQALQSLVERYGCIIGYPDRTFRGNRALSRYEFAAGLNACLDRMNELIAASAADRIQQRDLDTLQRLADTFAKDLAALKTRVVDLESRTGILEAQQFSTTTKLNGEVIGYLGGASGRAASDVNQTTISHRVRLNFDTSFNGKDRLRTRLQASNLQLFNAGNPNITNQTGGGFGAPQRFASTFPNAFSDEARILPSFASADKNNSSVRIQYLAYEFPVGDRLNLYLSAGETDPTFLGADPISPFSDFATGSISNFANSNPLYYPMGNQAGFGFDLKLTNWLTLAGGYAGQGADGIGDPNLPGRSSGIFNGGYTTFGQLTAYLGNLTAAVFYMNTYTPQFGIDTLAGSNAAKVSTGGFSAPFDDRVSASHFGMVANYRVNDDVQVGGWIGYANARVLGVDTLGVATGNQGNVKVLNYAVTLAFPDLLLKGNLGGIVVGMQPRVIDTSNARVAEAIGLPDGRRQDRNGGFHIEAFYRIQLNDNISITPGIFWLTAPNHDARNPDAVIGILRTSFVF